MSDFLVTQLFVKGTMLRRVKQQMRCTICYIVCILDEILYRMKKRKFKSNDNQKNQITQFYFGDAKSNIKKGS